jgi:hypothetical protein
MPAAADADMPRRMCGTNLLLPPQLAHAPVAPTTPAQMQLLGPPISSAAGSGSNCTSAGCSGSPSSSSASCKQTSPAAAFPARQPDAAAALCCAGGCSAVYERWRACTTTRAPCGASCVCSACRTWRAKLSWLCSCFAHSLVRRAVWGKDSGASSSKISHQLVDAFTTTAPFILLVRFRAHLASCRQLLRCSCKLTTCRYKMQDRSS